MLLGQNSFGISHAWLAVRSDNLFDLKRRYMLRRKVLHQKLAIGAGAMPFPAMSGVAERSAYFFSKDQHCRLKRQLPTKAQGCGLEPPKHTPPALLGRPLFCHMMPWRPFRAPPQSRQFSTFFTSWCLGVRCERTPQLRWDPTRPPTSLPRPFDHWAHSHTPRFLRGFSDLPHSLLGVRPRLSPHPGHDDWNPGQLGLQFSCVQDACQI